MHAVLVAVGRTSAAICSRCKYVAMQSPATIVWHLQFVHKAGGSDFMQVDVEVHLQLCLLDYDQRRPMKARSV